VLATRSYESTHRSSSSISTIPLPSDSVEPRLKTKGEAEDDVVVDTAKVTKCEAECNYKIGSTTRFASGQAMEESKSAYVKDCMSK
jgi:hypothetical protein